MPLSSNLFCDRYNLCIFWFLLRLFPSMAAPSAPILHSLRFNSSIDLFWLTNCSVMEKYPGCISVC